MHVYIFQKYFRILFHISSFCASWMPVLLNCNTFLRILILTSLFCAVRYTTKYSMFHLSLKFKQSRFSKAYWTVKKLHRSTTYIAVIFLHRPVKNYTYVQLEATIISRSVTLLRVVPVRINFYCILDDWW